MVQYLYDITTYLYITSSHIKNNNLFISKLNKMAWQLDTKYVPSLAQESFSYTLKYKPVIVNFPQERILFEWIHRFYCTRNNTVISNSRPLKEAMQIKVGYISADNRNRNLGLVLNNQLPLEANLPLQPRFIVYNLSYLFITFVTNFL